MNKEMYLSPELRTRILTDNNFSLELAKVLNRKQDYILRLARANDGRESVLFLFSALEFYELHGFENAILKERAAEA